MGILRGHAPLLTTLDIGEIVLHRGTETEYHGDRRWRGRSSARQDYDSWPILRSRNMKSMLNAPRPLWNVHVYSLKKVARRSGDPSWWQPIAAAICGLRLHRRRRIRHREAPNFRGDPGS